jgi:hypothetical protein
MCQHVEQTNTETTARKRLEEVMEDFEKKYHTHSYEHRLYPPGTLVYIDPSIREIHERSPVAGQYVKACIGTYPSSDDPQIQAFIDAKEQERSYKTKVPIKLGGQIWFIEEEYVRKANEVE